MREDSIAQIAKALARLVLIVSPSSVSLNFIVEWSKTVRARKSACDGRDGGPMVRRGPWTFYHKACRVVAFESPLISPVFYYFSPPSSAVLQVRRTICSGGLGYLICIQPLHHSLHSVEVTAKPLVPVLCLPAVQMVPLFTLRVLSLECSSVNASLCLCADT